MRPIYSPTWVGKGRPWPTSPDEDHQAWLYNNASLHSVDLFFNQVRRRLSLLERPIHSKSNKGRIWNGYSPYNPGNVANVLDIMRTVAANRGLAERGIRPGGTDRHLIGMVGTGVVAAANCTWRRQLITVDAGNLWQAAEEGLLKPVNSEILEANIPHHPQDPHNRWFGLSVRARTIFYSTQEVKPAKLSTYEQLGDAK